MGLHPKLCCHKIFLTYLGNVTCILFIVTIDEMQKSKCTDTLWSFFPWIYVLMQTIHILYFRLLKWSNTKNGHLRSLSSRKLSSRFFTASWRSSWGPLLKLGWYTSTIQSPTFRHPYLETTHVRYDLILSKWYQKLGGKWTWNKFLQFSKFGHGPKSRNITHPEG